MKLHFVERFKLLIFNLSFSLNNFPLGNMKVFSYDNKAFYGTIVECEYNSRRGVYISLSTHIKKFLPFFMKFLQETSIG